MAETCWSSVRGKVARLTQTDDCCKPVAGACGTIVTDGFVTVSYSPEIEEGEEILVKKANGAICVNDKSCDTLKRVNVEIEFCQVSPSIFARMTGNPVVTDHAGTPVGNRIGETVRCDIGFALEVWSDVPGARCTNTGLPQYGYFLVPCLTGGTIQDFTIENDAATFTVTGYSRPAKGWGTGPYDVDAQDSANTAGPLLTPFGAEEHMDMHLTTIAPPEAKCECERLTLPARYTTDTDAGGTVDAYDTDADDAEVGDSEPAERSTLSKTADNFNTGAATLSWTAVPFATSYDLEDDAGNVTNVTGTTSPVTYDPDNGPVKWTVRGRNAAGPGPASNTVTTGAGAPGNFRQTGGQGGAATASRTFGFNKGPAGTQSVVLINPAGTRTVITPGTATSGAAVGAPGNWTVRYNSAAAGTAATDSPNTSTAAAT